MVEFRKNEKLLKRFLKKRTSITFSLVIAFLISGIPFFNESINARDLRDRNKENNNILPEAHGPNMTQSANGSDVVNIVNPNKNGLSHNKFIDFNVGNGNNVIFNNNASEDSVVSKTGGLVFKNKNLQTEANTILTEVTGTKNSNINGTIEIAGKKADFILANENGINVNGASFINTNGVTLTTGNINYDNNGNINFNVQKGNILLNGVGTSGNYFNVLAKTIELHKEIASIKGEEEPDITLIAGENILSTKNDNLKNIKIEESKKSNSDKYGIYATELGAMYGKNIRLVSTDYGLGVKHEGLILSEKDINIESNGNISLNTVTSQEKINIKGNKNTNIQKIISGKNIDIATKHLTNSGVISAKDKLKVKAEDILNNEKAVFKGASLNLIAKNSFINKGDIRENRKDLNEFVDPNGKLKIEVTLGKFENYGNISAKEIEILTQTFLNSLTGKIIVTNGDILITSSVGDLINNGEIFSDKDIQLISKKDIQNTGKIGGENIEIQAIKGKFLNSGNITAIKDLEIIVKYLVNAGSKEEIEKYLRDFYSYSETELNKINKIIEDLNKKILQEKNQDKINGLKETLDYFKEAKESLVKLKESLSKTGNLGNISGKNVKVESSNDIENNGIITSLDTLNISGKNIKNTGSMQSKNNLFLKSIENIVNTGRITGEKDINISANSFVSEGNEKLLEKYLEYLKDFNEEDAKEINDKIVDLEKKLELETNTKNILELKKEIQNLQDKLQDFNILKSKISSFNEMGILEGNNIVITTVENLKNKGILISSENVILKSQGDVTNEGSIGVGKNLEVTANNFNSNNLTVGKKVNVNVKNMFSSKDATIGDSLDVQGNFLVKENLSVNKNFNVSGDIKTEKKSNISVKNDVSIGGNAELNGKIATNGNLNALNKEKSFTNKGTIEIGGDVNLNSKNIVNNDAVIGGDLNIDTKGDILNFGKLQVKDSISVKGKSFENTGNILLGGNLSANLLGNFKSKDLGAKGNISINSNGFENTLNILSGKDININANEGNLISNSLQSQGNTSLNAKNINIKKDIISSNLDIKGNLNTDGNIQSKGNLSVKSKDSISINSTGKLVSTGDINLSTDGSLTNKGMVVSNKNITADAQNIKNDKGTIWASKDINLKASKDLINSFGNIEAKENMTLTAKKITNEAGSIKAGKNLNINTDSLVNKSIVVKDIKIEGYNNYQTVTKWNDVLNYHLDYVEIQIPNIVDKSYVKDKASISSGGNINIKGYEKNEKTNVLNESGTIAASKNIDIYGDVTNKSHVEQIPIEWFLENIKVKLHWETKLYLTHAHGSNGVSFNGNLKDALFGGYFGKNKDKYYKSLAQNNDPLLNQVLSTLLGPDWKALNKPKTQDKWNKTAHFEYVATNAGGKILAGNNLNHSGGFFNNQGGESGGNKDINISVGEENVKGIVSNGNINIGDINQIKEVNGVKQIHDVQIQSGEITLNGITIKAETGNTIGSIAVAGTINPIVFIETPQGENGIFKPSSPKPNGIQPMYETNIEFIDPNKYFGSDYFFSQMGYDKNKVGSVIGDAYYEYTLISKMIQEGLGYTGELSIENVKSLLDNALKLQKNLGLEIGRPLTPEQVNKLDKNIIWYVEVEVNGQKTLTPQIYFSNDTRVNIANGQGSGGSSTVKAGGNITTDNTSFNNTNGNITADGNIIVKSKENINNNSYGGVKGGITSNNGNIALDSSKDINIKGGNVKGDNVLVSGNNINLESTLGTDKDGNQYVSDKGKISGNNGIQLDANNDINIKGGELNAKGTEVKPEDKPENNKETKNTSKTEIVNKDVKYYENLFKKDSADIIDGDSGSININAKGNVNIEDIYTVSSKTSHKNEKDNSETMSSLNAKSNGSQIIGSNINIKSDKDVNIKGSTLGTNDLLEENKDKNLKVGNINIESKENINISDSQDISYEKSGYKKVGVSKGLLTTKWGTEEKESILSKGSSLTTGGDINLSSGKDILLKGSKTKSIGDTIIKSEKDVKILDGREELKVKSEENRYQVLGGGKTNIKKESSLSKGSELNSGKDLIISSGKAVEIVNGKLTVKGDVNISAEEDILIEAGKNEFKEEKQAFGMGLYTGGNAGAGLLSTSGNTSTYSIDNVDGSSTAPLPTYPTGSGGAMLDSTAFGFSGIKFENYYGITDKTLWSNGNISGNNINIQAGKDVKLSGDYSSKNNLNVIGENISSLTYKDKITSSTKGFSLYFEDAAALESSVIDITNKISSMVKNGQELDPTTGTLQSVGSITTLLFNDLIGVGNYLKPGFVYKNNETKKSKETTSNINANNISFKSTNGDIALKGVDIKANDEISLDSAKNIYIKGSISTEDISKSTVDGELRFGQGASVHPFFGAGTGMNLGFHVSGDVTDEKSVSNNNSKLSGQNIKISAKENVEVMGGNINAENNLELNVGKDLNIESVKSYKKSEKEFASLGGRVGIGVASNTIVKGNISSAIGGGHLYDNFEDTLSSSIQSKNNMSVNVNGDTHMTGSILGSNNKNSNININGKLVVNDIINNSNKGGADVVISAGQAGEIGGTGAISDKLDKTTINTSAINSGKITVNNKNIENIGDINNNEIEVKNNSSKGGIFSGVGPVKKGYETLTSYKRGSYDVN